MLGRRVVSGDMYASSGQDGWYNFELVEVDEGGRGIGFGGIFIKGNWNPASNEHHCRIDGIELDERVYWMCPQAARVWWNRMELQGKVDAVVLNWHPQRPFSVEFAVSNVGLTLPIEAENIWARYHEGEVQPTASRPRMRVNTGVIRVSNDSIALEKMKGQLASTDNSTDLVSVPFNISFAMTSLPPLDWNSREEWMEQVLRTAPFDLQFRMDQFSLTRNEAGEAPALDLPVLVAKVLAKFSMTDWVMSTSLEMSRGMPTVDESGKLVAAKPLTNGQAYIHKASGKYQKFPYPLNDVDAYMQFDNEKVVVHYLNGKGSGNSQFRITGEIAPPENDASVLLRVSGTNVPLDERLRDAFREGEKEAFDSLFNREAFEALQRADLLPSEQTVERARQRLRGVAEQIAATRQAGVADDPQKQQELSRLQLEHSRLQRSIDAGPFQLGGLVNVDLKIERALGPKQPTTTTGTLQIITAGAVYEKFPYPMRVTSGTLELRNDGIAVQSGDLNEGLVFVTPGGGRGTITGELGFPKEDGKRKVQPNFVITVGDDEINEMFFAAIPMSKSQRAGLAPDQSWPGTLSKAALIVQGIGLSGVCDYAGVINTNELGKIGFDFDITMRNGKAQPTRHLAGLLGFGAEPWPSNLTLENVHGLVNVNREAVKWVDVTGSSGESVVVANGKVDYSGEDTLTTVAMRFERLPVDAYVLNAGQPAYAETLADLWTRFQPQGVFDAELNYASGAEGQADETSLAIQPRDMSVMIYGKRVGLTHRGGNLRIGSRALEFDKFAMQMTSAEQRDDGVLTLSGGRDRSKQGWSVTGDWQGARFESPLIPEVLNSADRDLAKRYRELRAAGDFVSRFTVSRRDPDSPLDYEISIEPAHVEARWNSTNLQAELQSGSMTIVPGELRLNKLAGTTAGSEFEVDGVVQTGELIDAQLKVAYTGGLRTNQVRAFLPKVAVDAFNGISFDDAGADSNANLDLRIAQMPGYAGQWKTKADGTIATHGASFEAGVLFTDVDGEFTLKVDYVPGVTPTFSIDSNVERAVALGQRLTNLRAPMALDEQGKSLVMPWLVGEAELGTVTASATVGVGDHRDYEVVVDLVSVPLDDFSTAQSAASAAAADVSEGGAAPGITATAIPLPTGDVYASLSVAGRRGEPESKRGRGTLRILNGNLANVPLVLQLMQMLQLTLPGSGVLDYADADMYLIGDRVVFERILFESTSGRLATLQLFGEGEMNFQTFELNTRFRARSGVRGLREVIGAISDKLYEIEVMGTLRNPQPRLVPLPSKN